MPIDYSKVSNEDLLALKNEDYSKVSTETLKALAGSTTKAPDSLDVNMPEAELGATNRAKYSLEPIQSNRVALLEQTYGKENVKSDQAGNLFINQNGYYRPVNKAGFGMSDVAEFAGALPEAIPEVAGAALGATGGLAAGAPLGPLALGTGASGAATGRAIGAGVGSLFRQALSSAAGTPQVATLGERAMETGMSAATGSLGGLIADTAPSLIRKIPGGELLVGKAGVPGLVENMPSTLAKDFATSGAVNQTPSEVGSVASGYLEGPVQTRDVVEQQMAKLKGIASRQGLPEPTYAQAAGGKAVLAEGTLMETPLIGGKVRQQVDKQLKAVKSNLEKITGSFIDSESNAYEVGLATKEIAQANQEVQKNMAQELYKKVDEMGVDATVGKRTFFNKYRDFAGEHGLINPDLSRAKYDVSSPYTPDEFKTLQDAVFGGLDAIKASQSPKIRFEGINAQIKKIGRVAENLRESDPNSRRLLLQLKEELDATAERTLNREAPKLGEVFKEANRNYAIYKKYESFNDKIFPAGMGEEKVVKKLMSDSAKIEELKGVIGEDRVREIGKSHVKDILEKLSKSGVARADTALNAIKKDKTQIISAIGEKDYGTLVDNLYYLNRVNQPLNIGRESLYSLFDETKGGLKGFGARIIGSAKTYSEATGKSLTAPVTHPIGRAYSGTIGKAITKGSIGNILTTQQQTEANR